MSRRRRTYRLPDDQLRHLSGVRADFTGDCARCPDPIVPEDRVVRRGGGWIHARCASGASDE